MTVRSPNAVCTILTIIFFLFIFLLIKCVIKIKIVSIFVLKIYEN